MSWSPDWGPKEHGYRGFIFMNTIFDKVIQFLPNSKVAKAELYLKGDYHNEWLELTYYIKTLDDVQDHVDSERIVDSHEVETQEGQESHTMKTQKVDMQLQIENNDEVGEPVDNHELEEPQDCQKQNEMENQENNRTEHHVVNVNFIFATCIVVLFSVFKHILSFYHDSLFVSSRFSLFFSDSFSLIFFLLMPHYYHCNPLLRQYVWQSIQRHMSSKHPQNNQEELENDLELEIQNWDEIEMESL